jgi:hypothetical protein
VAPLSTTPRLIALLPVDDLLGPTYSAPLRPHRLLSQFGPKQLLMVNFRQPSHEFTFNVGIELLF